MGVNAGQLLAISWGLSACCFLFGFVTWRLSKTPAGLARTVLKIFCCKGRSRAGAMTGVVFPVCVADLLGIAGPEYLTKMLRHMKHLPQSVSVFAIVDTGIKIKDGVKGDKVIIKVQYSGRVPAYLPSQFFVKFNTSKLSAMRLLVETTEVCKCEALFYRHLSKGSSIGSPKYFFVDYSAISGEFCLVSEVVRFGEGSVLPQKHRVRDETTFEEQHLFITAGAALNAMYWGSSCKDLARIPRFQDTHRNFWTVAQLSARWGGFQHTVKRTLKGREVNSAFMTWRPPPELVGREEELIRDMPEIMRSLCLDEDMVAFGHNDLTTDNVLFTREKDGLKLTAFDWQQSCVNNVGQEWAWNLHFLLPEFLDQHEAAFIDLILQTYSDKGVTVDRSRFMEAYVLGTVQMYVWGGGGLQLLMSKLHKHGIFESMEPNDARCREDTLEGETLETFVGAEMTRRTFTNVCNIMRRHDFEGAWARWREARAAGEAWPAAHAKTAAGGAASDIAGDASVRRRPQAGSAET